MVNEKEFKETFGNLNHEQLLDFAYKLQVEVNLLQEKNSSLNRNLYGRKRENVNVDQLSLFNEAEVVDETSTDKEKEEIVSKKKHGKNKKIKDLKVKVKDIVMDNPVCDICGKPLTEIKPKIIDRLVYIPSELYIERTVVHQYTCHECSEKEETFEYYKELEKNDNIKVVFYPEKKFNYSAIINYGVKFTHFSTIKNTH